MSGEAQSARGLSSIDAVAAAIDPHSLELGEKTSPDGAVTLLFSDIEGSTAMMERLGEDEFVALLRDHAAIVNAIVGSFEGTVVKSQGDGFMVSFSSAHAGLHCAIELQRTFAGQAVGETGARLKVRIGLHSGYVIADAEDFFGRNVVLAARIADRAGGGEILVSSALREYLSADRSIDFERLGEFRLKGLLGDHTIFAVRWSDAPGPSTRQAGGSGNA